LGVGRGANNPPPPVKNLYYETSTSGMLALEFFFVADACECGNEPPGSVKFGEFLV